MLKSGALRLPLLLSVLLPALAVEHNHAFVVDVAVQLAGARQGG